MFAALLRWLGIGRNPYEMDLDADPQTAPAPTPVPVPQVAASEPPPEGPDPEKPAFGVDPHPPWTLGGSPSSFEKDVLMDEVLGRLGEYLERAESGSERTFVQSVMDAVFRGQLDIPAFPDVARELDALLRHGDPMMTQVVRLVEKEPALVQRVWTRASSAEFGGPPKGLHFAISRLGFDDLWRLAIQVCLQSELFRIPGFQKEADHVRDHGLVCGDVAAELAGERRGAVYLAGLLHDVGKLMVYRHASVGLMYSSHAPERVAALVRELHPALGIMVAREWSLGESVAFAMGGHHNPSKVPEDHQRIAWLVRAADVATHSVDGERHGLLRDPKSALAEIPPDWLRGKDPVAVAQKSMKDFESLLQ